MKKQLLVLTVVSGFALASLQVILAGSYLNAGPVREDGLRKGLLIGGTSVRTPYGAKAIEKLRVGDEVLSYNEKTKQTELKTVTDVLVGEARAEDLLSVSIAAESTPLGVTTGYQFYAHPGDQPNAHGEWTPARNLKVGDQILTANGTWAAVESIGHATSGRAVFGLKLEDDAAYFVGSKGLLVQGID